MKCSRSQTCEGKAAWQEEEEKALGGLRGQRQSHRKGRSGGRWWSTYKLPVPWRVCSPQCVPNQVGASPRLTLFSWTSTWCSCVPKFPSWPYLPVVLEELPGQEGEITLVSHSLCFHKWAFTSPPPGAGVQVLWMNEAQSPIYEPGVARSIWILQSPLLAGGSLGSSDSGRLWVSWSALCHIFSLYFGNPLPDSIGRIDRELPNSKDSKMTTGDAPDIYVSLKRSAPNYSCKMSLILRCILFLEMLKC